MKIIDRMLSTFPLRYGISKYASNGISEDDIFKDYICIINEDFLLNPNAEKFFEKYENYIRDNKSVLIVPSIVVD